MPGSVKTQEELNYLLDPEDSPLSPLERQKLRREVARGDVRVVHSRQMRNQVERRKKLGGP